MQARAFHLVLEIGKFRLSAEVTALNEKFDFDAATNAHASFHRCAREVDNLSQAGRREQAQRMLEEKFAAQSGVTIKQFNAMQRVAAGRSAPRAERRGPNRATNVARLPAQAPAAPERAKLAVVGSDEQWEAF